MATVEIRRIRAAEWPELRDLRLAALRDAPLAFGATYEQDAALTEDRWRSWAADAASGAQYIAVAVDGMRLVAMARGSADTEDASCAFLTAVYVAPEWRGRGLGRAVSAAVIDWVRDRDVDSIRLHVAEWNHSAHRLYESLGFVATGATKTLPHDPSITELEMRLDLRR
jgi:GNAT superfamily N-acetyltransferase